MLVLFARWRKLFSHLFPLVTSLSQLKNSPSFHVRRRKRKDLWLSFYKISCALFAIMTMDLRFQDCFQLKLFLRVKIFYLIFLFLASTVGRARFFNNDKWINIDRAGRSSKYNRTSQRQESRINLERSWKKTDRNLSEYRFQPIITTNTSNTEINTPPPSQ